MTHRIKSNLYEYEFILESNKSFFPKDVLARSEDNDSILCDYAKNSPDAIFWFTKWGVYDKRFDSKVEVDVDRLGEDVFEIRFIVRQSVIMTRTVLKIDNIGGHYGVYDLKPLHESVMWEFEPSSRDIVESSGTFHPRDTVYYHTWYFRGSLEDAKESFRDLLDEDPDDECSYYGSRYHFKEQ